MTGAFSPRLCHGHRPVGGGRRCRRLSLVSTGTRTRPPWALPSRPSWHCSPLPRLLHCYQCVTFPSPTAATSPFNRPRISFVRFESNLLFSLRPSIKKFRSIFCCHFEGKDFLFDFFRMLSLDVRCANPRRCSFAYHAHLHRSSSGFGTGQRGGGNQLMALYPIISLAFFIC